MKQLLFFFGLIGSIQFIALPVNAQAFYQGAHMLSVGVGLGGIHGDYSPTSNSPTTGLSYEYGITEFNSGALGVGLYVGNKVFTWREEEINPIFYQESKWKYTIFGLLGNYHFRTRYRYDPYISIMGGVQLLNYSNVNTTRQEDPYSSFSNSKIGLAFSVGGGVRYFFANNIAPFVEVGYGVSYVTIGACFKIW